MARTTRGQDWDIQPFQAFENRLPEGMARSQAARYRQDSVHGYRPEVNGYRPEVMKCRAQEWTKA